jgi:energy-coupling factor transporter ATP-binding protein EcfA2
MSFEVRKAQRQGARLLIQLSGVSGSGKTFTALQLAYGLAGQDANKVVMIDTENRRGSLYANALPQPFNIIDFYAPFSPARYIEAISAAVNAGAEVIVIDSVTHEWESEGGCEWIANQTRFPDWKRAKAEHKRFMTYMLQSPAHIIACTRAREKVDFSDPKNPIKLGIQPIQEKNFSYEATVSLMMHDQGHRQDVLKCPAELQAVLGRGEGYIGAKDGQALRQWVDGAAQVDPAIEHHRGLLLNATERGLKALGAAWSAAPVAVQKALGEAFKEQLKASAKAYDEQRKIGTGDAPNAVNALNAKTDHAVTEYSNIDQPFENLKNVNAANTLGVF